MDLRELRCSRGQIPLLTNPPVEVRALVLPLLVARLSLNNLAFRWNVECMRLLDVTDQYSEGLGV